MKAYQPVQTSLRISVIKLYKRVTSLAAIPYTHDMNLGGRLFVGSSVGMTFRALILCSEVDVIRSLGACTLRPDAINVTLP